jgi:hypothetical protein
MLTLKGFSIADAAMAYATKTRLSAMLSGINGHEEERRGSSGGGLLSEP